MTSGKSWADSLHRSTVAMQVLLLLFIVIAAGYSSWHQHTSSQINRLANDYHLQASGHYLLASNELLQLQSFLQSSSNPPSAIAANNFKTYSQNSAIYLIQREIQFGLTLQNEYKNPQLASITQRLEQLNPKINEYLNSRKNRDQRNHYLNKLQTTLDQVRRLHTSLHDKLLDRHQQKQKSSLQVLYGLLASLLIGGALISWQGLKYIDRVIRSQQDIEERVKRQATHDSLTDLPNRLLILDRLSQLIFESPRHNHYVGVLFLDLDNFKKVNDSLGHSTGDQLLIDVGKRLTNCLRQGDSVGRLGGDEFVVLVSGLERISDINIAVEKIIAQLRTPFIVNKRELILTSSIGISVYPDDGQESSVLLQHADSAMYHSKSCGRNTYSYFTDKMNQALARRLILEEHMIKALELNEFEVFYQPQIDLKHGQIIGAEALLRWNSPRLENPGPDEFIPIAEQCGLINPIGKFVMRTAFMQCAEWQKTFFDSFRIAINLSPRQFRESNLVNTIIDEISNSGIDSSSVELEITEGVLLNAQENIIEALNDLANQHIILSMDDFGTGYSSLSYLLRYPFSTLKIDQSFVNDMLSDPKDRELIKATIAMAHNTQLKVIAEGVEEQEQSQLLKNLGCDYAQGYLYGKPMPAAEFTSFLQQQKTHRIPPLSTPLTSPRTH